jgi:hypothetical protein
MVIPVGFNDDHLPAPPRVPGTDLSDMDRRLMEVWGRYYARSGGRDNHALASAATYLNLAITDLEIQRVKKWWSNGVLDYAQDQDTVDKFVDDLEIFANILLG